MLYSLKLYCISTSSNSDWVLNHFTTDDAFVTIFLHSDDIMFPLIWHHDFRHNFWELLEPPVKNGRKPVGKKHAQINISSPISVNIFTDAPSSKVIIWEEEILPKHTSRDP